LGVFSEVAERFKGAGSHSRPTVADTLPTINDLVLATSKAMDLLEGKPLRAGIKVAVIGGSIAKMMGLPDRDVASVVYAGLLHDIGLVRMVSDIYPHLPPGMSEKQLFQTHALHNARVIGNPYERPISNDLFQIFHQHPLSAGEIVRQFHLPVWLGSRANSNGWTYFGLCRCGGRRPGVYLQGNVWPDLPASRH
jgi:response regulator RpfG family c-di-GMP phosphodiesterase